MKSGARLHALQEILFLWEEAGTPLDYALRSYCKSRRYIGSHDRRALAESLFHMMRKLVLLDWWIERLDLQMLDRQRWRVILYILHEERAPTSLEEFLNGMPYHSSPLTNHERQIIKTFLAHNQDVEIPPWVAANCPQWLYDKLQQSLNDHADTELTALNAAACLDVRVNTLKRNKETVINALDADGLTAEPMSFSPVGLRLPRGIALTHKEPYQKGWIEIQDEGSQLVALLVDAKPGMTVLDYCAGGGGKALTLAAAMNNKGRLVAADIAATRLQEAEKRIRRAGVTNVTCQLLPLSPREKGTFDRILVDAPCSGSGTWRRSPDLKFRLTPQRLEELMTIQSAVLEQAAEFVADKGRLIYATCSLLREENEDRIERFLAAHSDFTVIPYGDVWRALLKSQAPTAHDFLRLTPAQRHTDGFFVAILEKRAEK